MLPGLLNFAWKVFHILVCEWVVARHHPRKGLQSSKTGSLYFIFSLSLSYPSCGILH